MKRIAPILLGVNRRRSDNSSRSGFTSCRQAMSPVYGHAYDIRSHQSSTHSRKMRPTSSTSLKDVILKGPLTVGVRPASKIVFAVLSKSFQRTPPQSSCRHCRHRILIINHRPNHNGISFSCICCSGCE